jgi:membrane protease YdiL (CAAX protease family)
MFLLSVLASMMGQSADGSEAAANPTVTFVFYTCFYGVIVAFIHLMVRGRGVSWSAAFGFNSTRKTSAVLMAAGATLVVLPVASLLSQLSAGLMVKLHAQPVAQQSVQMLQNTVAIAPQIYLAIQAIILAPVIEEILFRGVLYPALKQQGYPKLALWGTSMFFGAMHVNMMLLAPLTFLGLMLVWLYERTDNLAAPIFAHSFFNLVNFVWAITGPSSSDWKVGIVSVIVGIAVLFRQWKRGKGYKMA